MNLQSKFGDTLVRSQNLADKLEYWYVACKRQDLDKSQLEWLMETWHSIKYSCIRNDKRLGVAAIFLAENWIEKDTDISKANEKIIVIKLIQVIVILAISAPIPQCGFRDGQKDHYSLIVFITVIVL